MESPESAASLLGLGQQEEASLEQVQPQAQLDQPANSDRDCFMKFVASLQGLWHRHRCSLINLQTQKSLSHLQLQSYLWS